MKFVNAPFVKGFIRMANDGWEQGWHERNGGNLSYRVKPAEVRQVKENFVPKTWQPIGTSVPGVGGEYFLVTGSGKYMRNVILDPEANICMIEIDKKGEKYRIVWGLKNGGRPTSELPSHLMNHEVKKRKTNGRYRVIYHGHPANLIALTFVLPLEDKIFSRELWEMATECPVVFPDGVGVRKYHRTFRCHFPELSAKDLIFQRIMPGRLPERHRRRSVDGSGRPRYRRRHFQTDEGI